MAASHRLFSLLIILVYAAWWQLEDFLPVRSSRRLVAQPVANSPAQAAAPAAPAAAHPAPAAAPARATAPAAKAAKASPPIQAVPAAKAAQAAQATAAASAAKPAKAAPARTAAPAAKAAAATTAAPVAPSPPPQASLPASQSTRERQELGFDWSDTHVNFSTDVYRKRYSKQEQAVMSSAISGTENVLKAAQEAAEEEVQKVKDQELGEVETKVHVVSDPVVEHVTDRADKQIANAEERVDNATEVIKKAKKAIKTAKGDIKVARGDQAKVKLDAAANVSRWQAEANETVLEAKKKAEDTLEAAEERAAAIMSDAEEATKGHKLVHFFQCGSDVVNIVQDQIMHADALLCQGWCTREAKFFLIVDQVFHLEEFLFASKPVMLPVSLAGRFWFSFASGKGLPDATWGWWFGSSFSKGIGLPTLIQRLSDWIKAQPWVVLPYYQPPWKGEFLAILKSLWLVTVNCVFFVINVISFVLDKFFKVLISVLVCVISYPLWVVLSALDLIFEPWMAIANWLAPYPARLLYGAWAMACNGPAAWFPKSALATISDRILYMVTSFDGFTNPWRPRIPVAAIQIVVRAFLFVFYEVFSLIKLTFWIAWTLILGIAYVVTLIPGCAATAVHFLACSLVGLLFFLILCLCHVGTQLLPVVLLGLWLLMSVLLTLPVMFIFMPLLCLYAVFFFYLRKPDLVVNCTKITTAAHFGAMSKVAGPIAGVIVLCTGFFIVMFKQFWTSNRAERYNLEDACVYALSYDHALGDLRDDDHSRTLRLVRIYAMVDVDSYVFGRYKQKVRSNVPLTTRSSLLRALVSMRRTGTQIYLVEFITSVESKPTSIAGTDQKQEEEESNERCALLKKILLFPFVLLASAFKTAKTTFQGVLPCVDNYSDVSTSMTFLHSGQPFFFAFNILGIIHNVTCGLALNPPPTSNVYALEVIGRVFQADVMEAASQVVRQNDKTKLFYEKVKIQANTENLMNLPVVVFAVLSLTWIDDKDMLPLVGDYLTDHGYGWVRIWCEFLACFVLVIGNVGLMSSTMLSLVSMQEGIGEAPQRCVELSKSVPNPKFKPDRVLSYLMVFEAFAMSITMSAALFAMDKRYVYGCLVVFFLVCRLPLQAAKMDWGQDLPIRVLSCVLWPLHPYLFTWPNLYREATLVRSNMSKWSVEKRRAFLAYYLLRGGLLLGAWAYFYMRHLNDLPVNPQLYLHIYDRIKQQVSECELGQHEITIPWYNATTKMATQKDLDLYFPWCDTFVPLLKFVEVLPLFRTCIVFIGVLGAFLLLPLSMVAFCRLYCEGTVEAEDQRGYRPLLDRENPIPLAVDFESLNDGRQDLESTTCGVQVQGEKFVILRDDDSGLTSEQVAEYPTICLEYYKNVEEVENLLQAAEDTESERAKKEVEATEFLQKLKTELERHVKKSSELANILQVNEDRRRMLREQAEQEAARKVAAEAAAKKAEEERKAREAARKAEQEREAARQREEAARQEAARQEAAKQEAAKQEAARKEAEREAARQKFLSDFGMEEEGARSEGMKKSATPPPHEDPFAFKWPSAKAAPPAPPAPAAPAASYAAAPAAFYGAPSGGGGFFTHASPAYTAPSYAAPSGGGFFPEAGTTSSPAPPPLEQKRSW